MFISTNRSSRILPKNFLRSGTLLFRGVVDTYFSRNWANGVWMWMPTEHRTAFIIGFLIYYISRRHLYPMWRDEVERTMIRRWGGTLEEVRQNLPIEDQIRARVYIEYEFHRGLGKAKDMVARPEGYDA